MISTNLCVICIKPTISGPAQEREVDFQTKSRVSHQAIETIDWPIVLLLYAPDGKRDKLFL